MSTKSLARAVERIVTGGDRELYPGEKLLSWIDRAKEADLIRINSFRVSDELKVERSPLLETCIRLVHEGVLDLNWDFHCTECNAVAGTHRHLQEATSGDHCPLCNVDFRNQLDRNVEVTFTPSARLYVVSRKFLDEQTRITVALHKEKKIRFPEVYVSGLDCLHVPLFRQIFETETLSLRESLRIGQVCIMFTDIKGSTALYDRLGDSAAYGMVRDHFDILFRTVEEHDGVIVKTIGDSVMASFKRPADGVAAAVAIQDAFGEYNRRANLRNEILVKVGLHAGSTIMVNLNNRLDYFGQAVNMAARIQNTAEGGEVIISDAVRTDRDAIEGLRGKVANLTKRLVELKGISGSHAVYRLNFIDADGRPGGASQPTQGTLGQAASPRPGGAAASGAAVGAGAAKVPGAAGTARSAR